MYRGNDQMKVGKMMLDNPVAHHFHQGNQERSRTSILEVCILSHLHKETCHLKQINGMLIYIFSFVSPSNIITFTRCNLNVPEQFSCFDTDRFLTKNSFVVLSVPFAITDKCKKMARITISLRCNVFSIPELLDTLLSVVHRHPGLYNCILNVVSRLFLFIQFQF